MVIRHLGPITYKKLELGYDWLVLDYRAWKLIACNALRLSFSSSRYYISWNFPSRPLINLLVLLLSDPRLRSLVSRLHQQQQLPPKVPSPQDVEIAQSATRLDDPGFQYHLGDMED